MRTSRQCTLVNIERSCDIWSVIAVGVQLSTLNSSARYIYNIRSVLFRCHDLVNDGRIKAISQY